VKIGNSVQTNMRTFEIFKNVFIQSEIKTEISNKSGKKTKNVSTKIIPADVGKCI